LHIHPQFSATSGDSLQLQRIFFQRNLKLNCKGSLTATTEDMAAEHYDTATTELRNRVPRTFTKTFWTQLIFLRSQRTLHRVHPDIRRSIFGNGPFWKQFYVCDRL